MQVALTQALDRRAISCSATWRYQRTTTDAANVFGFTDSTRASGRRHDGQLVAPLLAVPVAAPALSVHAADQRRRRRTSRTAPTCRATPASPATIRTRSTGARRALHVLERRRRPRQRAGRRRTRTSTHGGGVEMLSARGRHNLTVRRRRAPPALDILSQQDARGSVRFTGAATGSDLADFLLGVPHTSSIAFGNADKDFARAGLRRLRHRRLARQRRRSRSTPACDGSTRRRSTSGSAGSSTSTSRRLPAVSRSSRRRSVR